MQSEVALEAFPVVCMSPKGQVVIPEDVRERLGLKAGTKFVVSGSGDRVFLQPIYQPLAPDFDTLLREARRQARKAGMKRSDIAEAIAKVRAEQRQR